MYIVASLWEALPGKEVEFEQKGETMRGILAGRPEISLVEAFPTEEGNVMVILGYRSREDYEELVNKPGGFFETTAREQKLDETGRWVHSWRGESRSAVAAGSANATLR